MEEKIMDENDEDHVYILSLLQSMKSPNRFTNDSGTTGNSTNISSNSSAVVDDDSNTSESFSPSSRRESPDEDLMDNFNKMKTGHKLDDYILDILKSEKCKKKLHFESQKTSTCSTNSFLVSESSMDLDERTANPDSLEVSDVLNKHGLPSHKLDDVLHVALKIVKPLNMKIKKVQHSEEKKPATSISSEKGINKSTLVYTCHMCNFSFNSKDNKNRHMASKHSKRLSIRGNGKLRKNASITHNYALDTYENLCDLDKLGKYKTSIMQSDTTDHYDEHSQNILKDYHAENGNKAYTVLKMNKMSTETEESHPEAADDDSRDSFDDESTSDSYSCRRVEINSELRKYDLKQCCRTRTFSENMKLLNKHAEKSKENNQGREIICQNNTESSSSLPCQETVIETEAKFLPESTINTEKSLSSEGLYPIGLDEVSSLSFSSKQCSSSKSSASNHLIPPVYPQQPDPPVSPQQPEITKPGALLREKHWIILDASNNFNGPFYSDMGNHQGIHTKSEDIVGIKSIDDSSKNISLFQSCVPISRDSLDDFSNLSSSCSTRSANECMEINSDTIHPTTFKEIGPKDEYTSQEQGSGNVIEKFCCARHLTFLDYLSNYHPFKRLTFKTENSSCDASAFSPHNSNTSGVLNNRSVPSRDYILSPPKKRWKSYLEGD
ncbi:uncharacterized protein DDB_G0284459-like [Saccostrea cucullata]|uniref:uncharacterized protein DDB_G0284459-like n=1 Tax=Saccostrea cuccullata TaxID=36930 RepID=UPI002ED28437